MFDLGQWEGSSLCLFPEEVTASPAALLEGVKDPECLMFLICRVLPLSSWPTILLFCFCAFHYLSLQKSNSYFFRCIWIDPLVDCLLKTGLTELRLVLNSLPLTLVSTSLVTDVFHHTHWSYRFITF